MNTSAPAEPRTATPTPPRLRHRRDFVRAAKSGVEHSGRAFKLQGAARADDDCAPARFGFTVTKKVAGAVGRNRIRRRLKEALRVCGDRAGRPGHDYVFIARRAALTAPFPELVSQMADALMKVHHRRARTSHRHNSKNRLSAP